MALITCHECSAKISDAAVACPQCGAKPKKKTSLTTWIIGAVALAFMVKCTTDIQKAENNAPPAKSAAERAADADLNKGIAAGKMLKAAAKDPSSFKMESFLTFSGGATCYEYRAKNSFGAIVPGKAVFDGNQTLLTSDRDGNKFVKAWNSICTKPGGSERAGGLNLLGVW
jgi:hypothetical protein